jgi:glyoxylase-like metal-dependent hydrolase (beta-lactamase superfamily II)
MKIGKYNVNEVITGFLGLDGGAMFGVIPKVLWQKENAPDAANRIKLSTRNLLLSSGHKNILIDTGMGTKWDKKSISIYNIQQNESSLINELGKLNLKIEDITDVILTHLHFDHTGGSTKIENGKIIPTFPNAKYYVQKQNYNWALNPSEKDRASFIKDNFLPLFEEGIINLIDGTDYFDDEISLIVVNGHTFGQQLVKISDSNKTLLFCADLIPTASHIPLPYIMGYDLQPLVTIQEKKKILSEAIDKDWLLFFEHDPIFAVANVFKNEKGFKINDKFTSI